MKRDLLTKLTHIQSIPLHIIKFQIIIILIARGSLNHTKGIPL